MRCPDCGEVLEEEVQEGEPRCDACLVILYRDLLIEARGFIAPSHSGGRDIIKRIDDATK